MAQTAHTHSIRFGHGNANCGNITDSFNTTVYRSDEDAQIMRWLSPLEPGNRHHGVRSNRFGGVGDWLLETREFRKWRGGASGADQAVLFCSGNPGVGKTYLSSLAIDSLCDQARKEDIAVAGFYCDFLAQQEQTIVNIMGEILKQVIGRREVPKDLREAFQEGKKEVGGRRLLLADLMEMLKIAIASSPQVFICIDALDECLQKNLPDLLESLRNIVRESPRTKIFLTGRPHVKDDIQRYFPGVVVIPISPKTNDIRNYVEMRLDRDAEPEAMSNGLRADIVRIILEKIPDIFLLVSLNMDAILGEVTIRHRRKKLDEMARGNGLSDAYTATLARLKTQKRNKSVLGMKVLMWVLYSKRPLSTGELCCALGVEIGSTHLDLEGVPTLRTLLSSCLGLVTVEASSSTVRLVHYTLQEHLLHDATLFHGPHSAIAEVCLTYLNFGSVWDLPLTRDPAPPAMPFLKYASHYWGDHTREGMTENVKTLALKLLNRFDEHISAQLLSDKCSPSRCSNSHGVRPRRFTGLHGGAFFGMAEIVAALLEMKEWDVNVTDYAERTALELAVQNGHEEVVKRLLEREDINLNRTDAYGGQTLLSQAAMGGHEGVVKVLLKRKDINPNQARALSKYTSDYTPLLWALRSGHEGIVKMLLEQESVNPNQAGGWNDCTALLWAAEHGHEGIVKMILKRKDVNPDQADRDDRTPLSWAAGSGHEGIVMMLSEREGVNLNGADNWFNRTALWWAISNRHGGVVKILLEREGLDPNTMDTQDGQAKLSLAAQWGCEGIVKMFLEREGVNPDRVDTKSGRTLLSLAAGNGQEGMVKMLLEQGGVSPGLADTGCGRTPLSWAARYGHEGVVKTLLEQEDVNPDHVDTLYGRTPLSWAAEEGHVGVVKILLERGGVNPDHVDTFYGRTPLLWAAANGNQEVLKMLLEQDVNPNYTDTKHGRTPLSWAAGNGHIRIVDMLLKRWDVNPDQADPQHGQTPLLWAAENGYNNIVSMLLRRVDVNPHQADAEYGQRRLSPTAAWGLKGRRKMLLEGGRR